ncbi:TPA: hypothetical protein ACS7XE_001491 [Providencia alcalifaciens]
MSITLNAKRVVSLTMNQAEIVDDEKDGQLHINLGSEIFKNNNDKKLFRVRYPFNLEIKGLVKISLSYDFDFTSEKEINNEMLSSELVTITAPSIAYPYIKTYVENILSSSGYAGITIPYLDFNETPLNQRKK